MTFKPISQQDMHDRRTGQLLPVPRAPIVVSVEPRKGKLLTLFPRPQFVRGR